MPATGEGFWLDSGPKRLNKAYTRTENNRRGVRGRGSGREESCVGLWSGTLLTQLRLRKVEHLDAAGKESERVTRL